MIFSDPFFLFLVLPVTVALFYWAAPRLGKTVAMAIVFAASLIIYWPWGERNVTILLASVTVNFLSAAVMLGAPPERRALRRSALIVGQSYNLLTLVWFKYKFVQGFYYGAMGVEFTAYDALIPIGISFYTFQQAAVLADAYSYEPNVREFLGSFQKWSDRARGFIRYSFFVTFFPHMIIGPIAYVHEIWPQLASTRFGRMRRTNISVGLMLIGIGMFKKLVLADNLGTFADPVFSAAAHGGTLDVITGWIGVFAYYTQLYFDFSGYSDMALGLARLFGIIFPINFFSPLKSVGIIDFYRRWHMTLTRVISRFLFSPLSLWGTRFTVRHRIPPIPTRLLRLWLPLLLNFEVIGLWHGALWTFVFFGAVHGLWYVAEIEVRATKAWKSWRKRSSPWARRILGRMMFTVPMALTFAAFRSESLSAFFHLVHELARFQIHTLHWSRLFAPVEAVCWIAMAMAVIHLLPNSVELLRRYRPGIMTYENEFYGFRLLWRPSWPWALFWLALVVTALYYIWRQPPFLYMGF